MCIRDRDNCTSSEAVPVLQISGLVDEVVPVDGSMSTFGGWGGAPDYITVNDYWAEKNETSVTETVELSTTVEATYHRDGINDNEVWLYAISDMGHTWPGALGSDEFGVIAAEVIWDFFSLKVESVTSIDNLTSGPLMLFPNPTSDVLYIRNAVGEALSLIHI